MTDAAIISGSLVDVRNVGTHKSVKLTIHVPEEYAMRVMEAFGWPTGVKPVAVAVARFDESVNREQPRPVPVPSAGADKPKSPAQIAGYLCTVQAFQRFLADRYTQAWKQACVIADGELDEPALDEDCAAECVRGLCNVKSRSDLTDKNVEWNALRLAYQLWLNEPDLDIVA